MRKATISPSGAKKRLGTTGAAIDQIRTSLQVLAQSLNQMKAHEEILRAAGVRLDRAGSALLYKLRLHGEGSVRVTDLAGLLGVDAPTVTRKVQQLERLEYVAREADPDDGRATRIQLTKSGQETLDRILEAHRERLEGLFDEWDDHEVVAFSNLLGKFTNSIRSDTESHSGE